MTKDDLYTIAGELGITDLLKAAVEFERKDCENICKTFAMNEKRIEVSAALNRAADMIRIRAADTTLVGLPTSNQPKDFLTYVN